MSCESLKNLVLYSGLLAMAATCIWSTLVQNKLNSLIKINQISKERLKKGLDLPEEVKVQISKLKISAMILLGVLLLCVIFFIVVANHACSVSS